MDMVMLSIIKKENLKRILEHFSTNNINKKRKKMKTDERVMKKEYVSPLIEVIEVDVEEGFAMSVEIKGAANDFTTNSFGNGDGGSTMGDF